MFIVISGTSFARGPGSAAKGDQAAPAASSQMPPATAGQDAFYGEVVSVDVAKGQVQMKEKDSGTEKTFAADKKILDTLKPDDNVKLNMKKGSTVIESVERGPSQQQGNAPPQQQ